MLIVILLILIAIGVLLISEPGQILLGWIIGAVGIVFVIAAWLLGIALLAAVAIGLVVAFAQ